MLNLNLNWVSDAIKTLSQWWPVVKANFQQIQEKYNNHAGGTADKHNAQHITYSGNVAGATNVKEGLDKLRDRVEQIITTPADSVSAQEIIEARGQEDSLGGRFDRIETQLIENAKYANPKLLNIGEKRSDIPIITFIDDDGTREVYTRLMPIFREKEVGFGSSIITGFIDNTGYMTLQQLKECHDNGLETLSHTYNVTTNLTDGYTDEQIEAQLRDSQEWLKNNGFEYEGFVYPQNTENFNIRKITRRYYNYAFGPIGFNDSGYLEHSRIKRIAFGSWTNSNPTVNGNNEKNTLAYYKACVDYAKENKIWLVFMSHIAQQPLEQDDILRELIDYIKSQGIPILKPSEAFRIKANKLSIGEIEENHIWINDNGIKSNALTVWEPYNGRTAQSPITDYEKGRITIIQYLASYNGGFPANTGISATYRSDLTDQLSFQIFYDAANGEVYKRHWKNNQWGEFAVQNISVLPTDSVNNSVGLLSFPRTISYCVIQTANANGFPYNTGGLLITNRVINAASFVYQMYKPYNKNEIWIRNAINNNEWGPWVLASVPSGFEIIQLSMPEITVPANSAIDVVLTYENAQRTDFITGNPQYGLLTGVLYSVMCLNDGEIIVRLYNATSSDKTITSRPWRFQRVP